MNEADNCFLPRSRAARRKSYAKIQTDAVPRKHLLDSLPFLSKSGDFSRTDAEPALKD
jgi:hypothetical protein